MAVFHLGTAGAFSLLILLVTDVLGAPEIVFGIVLAAAAIGATLASLAAAQLTSLFSRRLVITSTADVAAISVIAASAARTEWQLITA